VDAPITVSVHSFVDPLTGEPWGPDGLLHLFVSDVEYEVGNPVPLGGGLVATVVESLTLRSADETTQQVFVDLRNKDSQRPE